MLQSMGSQRVRHDLATQQQRCYTAKAQVPLSLAKKISPVQQVKATQMKLSEISKFPLK